MSQVHRAVTHEFDASDAMRVFIDGMRDRELARAVDEVMSKLTRR